MNIYGMSDNEILREMGARLRQQRLARNVSQQQLADRTGLNRTTISDMEHGAPFGVLTLIQVLRELGALDGIDLFLPEPSISPLRLAELKGRERQRASRHRAEAPGDGTTW